MVNRESIHHLFKHKKVGASNETKNLLHAMCGSAEEFWNRIQRIVELVSLKNGMNKFIKEKYPSVS